MSDALLLAQREAEGRPIRVAQIGAGKFGTMILAQLRLMRGVQLVALADLDLVRARSAAVRAGWAPDAFAEATSASAANDVARGGRTALVPSGELAAQCEVDIVIEATGHEAAGALHAVRAIEAGRSVIMVTVEADVVVGPYLHELARRNGVVYSLAYGDQPALICELIDWAQTCGLRVVAAGKGTKYMPEYRRSTPSTALEIYGFTAEQIAGGDFNPKMFNSFLDGTKSAIEMVAVANASGLRAPDGGLSFTPTPAEGLAQRYADAGGIVDVVTCMDERGGFVPGNLRWGVFVVFTSDDAYARKTFDEYGLSTDATGQFAAMWRPYHLIGLELGVSIARVGGRGEPTGAPRFGQSCDVIGATRQAMRAGDLIDGEGGFACYGSIADARSVRERRLVPLGLASGLRLIRDVPQDHPIGLDDVDVPADSFLWQLRRAQDAMLAPALA